MKQEVNMKIAIKKISKSSIETFDKIEAIKLYRKYIDTILYVAKEKIEEMIDGIEVITDIEDQNFYDFRDAMEQYGFLVEEFVEEERIEKEFKAASIRMIGKALEDGNYDLAINIISCMRGLK
jgi:hypothetical protein